tara:strand:- start:41 stop:313 length:273 start_codon:yes stop_codon:yes gene_type:complete
MNHSQVISIITWTVPLVFGAGALYHVLTSTADAVDELEAAVEEHADLVGHPVTAVKLEEMEQNQQIIMEEQRQLLREVGAICQVTGAECR